VPWNCDLSKDIYTCFFLSFDQGHNYIAQEMYRLGICRQLFLDTVDAKMYRLKSEFNQQM